MYTGTYYGVIAGTKEGFENRPKYVTDNLDHFVSRLREYYLEHYQGKRSESRVYFIYKVEREDPYHVKQIMQRKHLLECFTITMQPISMSMSTSKTGIRLAEETILKIRKAQVRLKLSGMQRSDMIDYIRKNSLQITVPTFRKTDSLMESIIKADT